MAGKYAGVLPEPRSDQVPARPRSPVILPAVIAAEAIGVTFLMNGGPATVYGARAFAAFREFYDQRSATNPGAAPVQTAWHEHGQPNGHQHAG